MRKIRIRIAIAGMVMAVLAGIAYAQARYFKEGSVTVNPYTAQTVTLKQVKGLFIYAPDIGYKISFNGTNYTPMGANGAFNFSNIDADIVTLKLQGKTGTDTGIVYYIYQQ